MKRHLLSFIVIIFFWNFNLQAQTVSKKAFKNLFFETYASEQELIDFYFFDYAGDVNGDGKRDFLYTKTFPDIGTENLTDFLRKRMYYFGGAELSTVPDLTQDLSIEDITTYYPIGDLNGDGSSDWITGNRGSRQIAFDLSAGQRNSIHKLDVSFNVIENISGGDYVSEFDLNNDGFEDAIVFSDEFNLSIGTDIEFEIIIGAENPDSIKVKDQTIKVVLEGESENERRKFLDAVMTPYDFQNDGKQEIVVFGFSQDFTSGRRGSDLVILSSDDSLNYSFETVLELDEPFAFDRQSVYQIKPSGSDLALFIQNRNGEKKIVQISESEGVYTLETELDLLTKFPYVEVYPAGDLDNDGLTDFFGRLSAPSTGVILYYSDKSLGDYTEVNLSSQVENLKLGFDPLKINTAEGILGDINGDNIDDLVLYAFEGDEIFDPNVTSGIGAITLNGNESRNIEDVSSIFDEHTPIEEPLSTFNAGDFNNDGIEDYGVLFRNSINHSEKSRIELFFGKEDKTDWETPDLVYQHEKDYSLSYPAVGDFNGDGISDLVINFEHYKSGINFFYGSSNPDATIDHQILLLEALGVDSLSNVPAQYPSFSTLANIGDINGDEIDDLGYSRPYSSALEVPHTGWYVAYGGEEITNTYDFMFDGHMANLLGLGDIDNDGKNEFFGSYQFSNGAEIFEYDSVEDQIITDYTLDTPELEAGSRILSYGSNTAIGDYNGDGFKDLIVSSPFHSDGGARVNYTIYTYEGGDALFIYFGGNGFDNVFDHSFKIPIENLRRVQGTENLIETEFVAYSNGEITTIPDLDGDGTDEILFGTNSLDHLTNALIFKGNNDSLNIGSDIVHLEGLNQNIGLGSTTVVTYTVRVAKSAVGDFNSDDYMELLLPQSGDPNFKSDAVLLFDLSDRNVSNEEVVMINGYNLNQNYPNPFNPSTNISYSIPKSSNVSLKVYDITGRLISTLVDKKQSSGNYTVTLNASAWASGVYFYQIIAGDFINSKKLTLIK